jgi:hypothetical protein
LKRSEVFFLSSGSFLSSVADQLFKKYILKGCTMGNKKEKTMTVEGARRLLEVITKYETTKEGDPKRGHFGDIIWTALDVNAVKRDEDGSLKAYGISKDAVSKAFKSISGDVDPESRLAFIRMLKGRIDALVERASAPAAAASGQIAEGPAATL